MSSVPSVSEFSPTTKSELARFVAANAAGARKPILPVGGRTALPRTTGHAEAIGLQMGRLNAVVDYPTRDMTITVEAGLRFAELEEKLKVEGQQLPIDVPQAGRATLGGIVACNVSGSRRYGYGTMRDYLLGVSAVDGTGREFSAGGRVVKNVAGYDLCKLLVGSYGTLGVVTQMTLKLKPIPPRSGILWATYDSFVEIEDVLQRLLLSEARPVSIDVLNLDAVRMISADCRRTLPLNRPALLVGVEGTEVDVAWQMSALTRELAPLGPDELFSLDDEDCRTVRLAMTEFPTESDSPLSFKATLRPSSAMSFAELATQRGLAAVLHAGNGIVHGHLPETTATLPQVQEAIAALQQAAKDADGFFQVTRCGEGLPFEWQQLASDLPGRDLMTRLKSAFDPHGVLNPGSLFAG